MASLPFYFFMFNYVVFLSLLSLLSFCLFGLCLSISQFFCFFVCLAKKYLLNYSSNSWKFSSCLSVIIFVYLISLSFFLPICLFIFHKATSGNCSINSWQLSRYNFVSCVYICLYLIIYVYLISLSFFLSISLSFLQSFCLFIFYNDTSDDNCCCNSLQLSLYHFVSCLFVFLSLSISVYVSFRLSVSLSFIKLPLVTIAAAILDNFLCTTLFLFWFLQCQLRFRWSERKHKESTIKAA